MVKKSLKVHIFRHGDTQYLHRAPYSQTFAEADDLTSKGVNQTIRSSKILIEEIKKENILDEKIVIWSSPVPRARYTAKIIYNELLKEGIDVEGPQNNLFYQFEEVRNLGNYLETLGVMIEGGEVEENGKKIIVEKSLVNPKNIPYPDYYVWGEMFKVDKTKLPLKLVNWIESIESFKDVATRITNSLSKVVKGANDKNYRIIIATHDSTGYLFMNLGSNEKELTLPRGEYISLEREGNELKVTGSSYNHSLINSKEGVFSFFKRKILGN